eukprot:g6481.t1
MMASQNPVLTYDRVNRRVLLVFNKVVRFEQYYDIWSMHSTDGLTWSSPRPHDSEMMKLNPPRNGTLPGPGNGVQLSIGNNSGRIVVPVYWNTCGTGNPTNPDCVAALFSDDGGTTFLSSKIATDTGWYFGFSESTVAETADGTVILNMRNSLSGTEKSCNCRGYAISADGGESFGKVMFDHELLDSGCQGSIVAVPADDGSRELYFSNPHNRHLRQNLTVQRANSAKNGSVDFTWTPYVDLGADVPAAYSCLAVLRKENGARGVGLLFETSVEDPRLCKGMCCIKYMTINV